MSVPRIAFADDLGVLVFPLFVWPMMLIFGIALIVFSAIGVRALKRAKPTGRLGAVTIAVALALDGVLAAISLFLDQHFSKLQHIDDVLPAPIAKIGDAFYQLFGHG